MRRSLCALVVLLLTAPPARADTLLAHDVFFALNDASDKARAELAAACRKYLSGHEGVVYFSVGNPRHKQFIAEQQSNWKKVRVFDSIVDVIE